MAMSRINAITPSFFPARFRRTACETPDSCVSCNATPSSRCGLCTVSPDRLRYQAFGQYANSPISEAVIVCRRLIRVISFTTVEDINHGRGILRAGDYALPRKNGKGRASEFGLDDEDITYPRCR